MKKRLNTEIYLWLKPLIMDNKPFNKKIYINCIVEGNFSELSKSELEDLISGKIMESIMEYANIYVNDNYGIISAQTTSKGVDIKIVDDTEKIDVKFPKNKEPVEIKYTKSPEEKQKELTIKKIISSKKSIELTKNDVLIKEDGMIEISLPSVDYKQDFDFSKIWDNIEKNIVGKLKEDDKIVLTDDSGNIIIEVLGGSFLNVGLADLSIYNSSKKSKNNSFFDKNDGLIGGLFIRDDGSMDIGDIDRTFYIKIYTNNMLKQSLKLGKSFNDLSQLKISENN